MKKILCVILLVSCFIFIGCSSSDIESVSKNINSYTLNFEYNDESKTVQLNEKLEYKNRSGEELEDLYFHLYPNAFKEDAIKKPVGVLSEENAYPNGKSYGGIEIQNVQVDGKKVEIELYGEDDDFLKIDLAKNLHEGKTIEVEISALITLPNIKHRFGYGENTINLANAYPIIAMIENGEWVLDGYNYNGDPFYSEVANYDVAISAPSNLKFVSSGIVENKESGEGLITYKVKAKAVRDFAFVLSEKFNSVTEVIDGVEVNYYYFDDVNSEKNLETSVKSVQTFNELFGKYPYPILNVVQSDFVHGGMEYPNLVLISYDVGSDEDYTNVIVHEIAHQWWYGVVGNNEFKNSWLDEGLTEYSTLLFYENNEEYNINPEDMVKSSTNNYALFVELYTKILGSVDTSMDRRLDEFDTEPEYVYITYVKGMLFFDNIREIIGTKSFLKGLQTYYKNNSFKNASPDDLLNAFQSASGKDLKGIFESWIKGKISIISVE